MTDCRYRRRPGTGPRRRLYAGALIATLLPVPATVPAQGGLPTGVRSVPALSGLTDNRLQTLVGLLSIEDPLLQWGLASIALEVLIEGYSGELEQSFKDRRSSRRQRAKLIGWQAAVDGYITRLQSARARLDDGEGVELFVDSRQRVVIAIGDLVVLVEAPPGGTVAGVEREIVDRFCDYNDCDWLGLSNSDAPASAARGQWSFSQGGRPRYRLGQDQEFQFADLADRDFKASAADQAADEVEGLLTALSDADRQGHRIDWRMLAGQRPIGRHQNIAINADGSYVAVRLRWLPRLAAGDWTRVVEWLAQSIGTWAVPPPLVITDADKLLSN